jgi:hypothetical protein
MEYVDILLLIEDRKESFLAQDINSLITDRNRYFRNESGWSQDLEPGHPESKNGRGGQVWYWKKNTE